MSGFRVRWFHTCYMCNCPLNIIVDKWAGGLEFISRIQTYYKFKPIMFIANTSRIKVINLHMRHVCTKCFLIQKTKMSWLGHLKNREINGKKITTMYEEFNPLTENEIYEWFKGFHEFQTRKDVNEYILNDNVLEGVHGIILLKSFDNF